MGATSRSDITKSLCPTSQSDLHRATHRGCSHLTPLSERPSWSDPVKSLAIFIPLEAQSDLPRATCPERRTEVARISHPSRSDLPKRHPEVARFSMARRHEAKPGATSQSDPLRSLPKAGATCRSDIPRSLRVYCWVDFYFT
ncbi:hypothetical protein DY000_02047895 [Brassica cretica]|uniref:Uncharacterized protein n=1 Tax=Brassica cretica TaxID=69181 RepID=A0ABQ7EPI9_BRACR|nr:hypothetical protein DY000_02047895 [Brassica cretica]